MLTALQESFWDRLGGVITLKRPAYETLQLDPAATPQAWFIVLFLGLANGIALVATPIVTVMPGMSEESAALAAQMASALTFETAEEQILALLAGMVGAVLSWYLSAWLLRLIGNRVAGQQGHPVNGAEMRRLVGWGYAPSLASFLAPIPFIGPILATLGAFWALATGVMAVRVAFNVGIWKAIGIEIAAFLVVLVVAIAVVTLIVLIAWPSA